MTPKEYAISLGLAKPGKGRMSLAAHEAIDKAISEGRTFDVPLAQQAKAKAATKAATTPKPLPRTPASLADGSQVTVSKAKVTPWEEGAVNVAEARYPDTQRWKSESGQILNGTQVCSNSGFSLGWCTCDEPKAVVSPGVIETLVLV